MLPRRRYLASLIQSDEAVDVLAAAAASAHEVVRVAAAAGLKNTTAPRAAALADQLMGDADAGVRKQALTAAAAMDSPNAGSEDQAHGVQ